MKIENISVTEYPQAGGDSKISATGTVDGTPRTVEVWKSALPTDAEPDKQLALQTGFLIKQLLSQIPTEPFVHDLPFTALTVHEDGTFTPV